MAIDYNYEFDPYECAYCGNPRVPAPECLGKMNGLRKGRKFLNTIMGVVIGYLSLYTRLEMSGSQISRQSQV